MSCVCIYTYKTNVTILRTFFSVSHQIFFCVKEEFFDRLLDYKCAVLCILECNGLHVHEKMNALSISMNILITDKH